MIDYAQTLSRIEEGLGRRYRESRSILNVPGVSAACKVDAFYYLALRPAFVRFVAKWAGMLPRTAEEALIKTGSLIVGRNRERHEAPIKVFDEHQGRIMRVTADFLPAAFIDRALAMHGGEHEPLPTSSLRLHASEREALETFFEGKTPLQGLAFGVPEWEE